MLKRIHVRGFKSIHELDVELTPEVVEHMDLYRACKHSPALGRFVTAARAEFKSSRSCDGGDSDHA